MLVTVSPKGQIVIPQVLRERLGILPSMKLDISVTPDGHVVVMRASGLSKAARAIALLEPFPTKGLSTDDAMCLSRGEDD